MWAELTEDELFEQSSLILSGRVIDTSVLLFADEGLRVAVAVIAVDEVYKGSPSGATVLVEIPVPDPALHTTEITYTTGQSGLWFLRPRSPEDEGIYLADHPQRFVAGTPDAALAQRLNRLP